MDRRSVFHAAGWTLLIGAVALVGTAQALPGRGTVDSGDIINGEVMRRDIGRNAVNSKKIRDESITSADIGPLAVGSSELQQNSVSGGQVRDGSLSGADIANNSITPADVNFDANGCETGLVHSWARVKGSPGMPTTFTSSSTHRDTAYNCSGGSVLVKRLGIGNYLVRFTNDPAVLAQVTADLADGDDNNYVNVHKVNDRDFQVIVRNGSDGTPDDGYFIITTF